MSALPRELSLSPALRWTLLAGVAAVELVLLWSWVEPGPLSIDEVTYHRMTRDLLSGHGLSIWNGWTELPSPELTSMFIKPAGDRLVAQYPYGLPLIAAPFYAVWGYMGLFLVNTLAFVGTIALCWRVSMQLLNDQRIALGACFVLAGGTYAWEYSMAAWPHALSMLCGLAAFSLAVAAWRRSSDRRAIALAAASGLVLGCGIAARLDLIFCAPVLVVPFLFAARVRFFEVLAFGAGTLPALALMSATNLARWGAPSPLTYGRSEGLAGTSRYAPLAAIGLAAVALLWLSTRPAARKVIRRNARAAAATAFVAAVLIVAIPATRELLFQLLRGARCILLDMRTYRLDAVEPAMTRSASGAVIYGGAIKKAFVQSLPYLLLLIVPLVAMVRHREKRAELAMLLGFPAMPIAFYSFSSWHGGMCLNMRYFVPALPFTSILVAYAVLRLISDVRRRWYLMAAVGVSISLAAYAALRAAYTGPSALETILLDVPLAIALLIALAVGAWLLRPGSVKASAALALAAAGIAWAGAVAFQYDAAWANGRRTLHHQLSYDTAAHIEPDSLLLADSPDRFYGVIEYRDRVRVAVPWTDGFRDAKRLISYHLGKGRRVYAVLARDGWNALGAGGALSQRRVRPIARLGPHVLAEIVPAEAKEPTSPPPAP